MRLKRTMYLIQTPVIAVLDGFPVETMLTVGIAVTERHANELCTDYAKTTNRDAQWVEVPFGLFSAPKEPTP